MSDWPSPGVRLAKEEEAGLMKLEEHGLPPISIRSTGLLLP